MVYYRGSCGKNNIARVCFRNGESNSLGSSHWSSLDRLDFPLQVLDEYLKCFWDLPSLNLLKQDLCLWEAVSHFLTSNELIFV